MITKPDTDISQRTWRRYLVNADPVGRRKGGVLGPVGKSERRVTKVLCPACRSQSCGTVRAGLGQFSIAPEPVERAGATVAETMWTFTCGKGKCAEKFRVPATLALHRIVEALHAGNHEVAVDR